jgi:hypothetical protein
MFVWAFEMDTRTCLATCRITAFSDAIIDATLQRKALQWKSMVRGNAGINGVFVDLLIGSIC